MTKPVSVSPRLQQDPLVNKLFTAILSLRTEDECSRFFDDLCTIGEIKALAQRLEVACMLESNCTYSEISQKVGASTATISRVRRFLRGGAGGYRLVMERMRQRDPVLNRERRELGGEDHGQ